MSSNNDTIFAHSLGKGVATAFAMNAVHPLYNAKNAFALNQPLFPQSCVRFGHRFTHLYRGVSPLLLSDLVQCPLLFLCNSQMKARNVDQNTAAAAAGAISALPSALAEDLALYQNKTRLAFKAAYQGYFRNGMLRTALPGIAATAIRDIPYGLGVLVLPGYIAKLLPMEDGICKTAVSGLAAGVLMGGCSAPLDMAKSRIQTHRLSFVGGYRSVWNEMLCQNLRQSSYLRFTAARILHISVMIMMTSLANAGYNHSFGLKDEPNTG